MLNSVYRREYIIITEFSFIKSKQHTHVQKNQSNKTSMDGLQGPDTLVRSLAEKLEGETVLAVGKTSTFLVSF